jgi:hypothetical protein
MQRTIALALCTWIAGSAVALAQSGYVTPKTPWGDPDLQGQYTNKYEAMTPFERPKEFEGRRIEDVTPAELAKAVARRQADTLERAKFFGGDPEGRIGNSAEFRDIYEINKGSRPWFVVDPADGAIPPLRPDARGRAAQARGGSSFGNGPFNSHLDFSLWERCITRGIPGSMLPGQYGNSYEIVQAPGMVAIRYEMIHETRVIPLDPSTGSGSSRAASRDDGRQNASSALRMDMGVPRGHWEGDTLVVETTNFSVGNLFLGTSPDVKLTERYTRVSKDFINWEITVDDPATWTKPWTFMIRLKRSDDQLYEYACHEGNHSMVGMLAGARAKEAKEAAAGRTGSR